MIRLRVAVPTALGLLVAADASAQWSYVNLHPAGATESRAIATTDYCAVCGGTPRGMPSWVYKRTACAAPVACP